MNDVRLYSCLLSKELLRRNLGYSVKMLFPTQWLTLGLHTIERDGLVYPHSFRLPRKGLLITANSYNEPTLLSCVAGACFPYPLHSAWKYNYLMMPMIDGLEKMVENYQYTAASVLPLQSGCRRCQTL